ITRRRSSQIAGTLALLSPVGASLRQPKHWQVALRNEISRFIFSRFFIFVNPAHSGFLPLL
ncbi:hypothetical protein, partial [Proteus mirabilis]|uniref:hypothetical protein n=1 Tax=Proteus mirabilis TaxID=584 RepID=UPI00195537E9